MNEKKQQIEIAKLCGYKKDNPNVGINHEKIWGWWAPNGKFYIGNSILPNYLEDLNQICFATLKLISTDKVLQVKYIDQLLIVLNRDHDREFRFFGASQFCLVHASARQRAEALLKTLNLWEDSFEVPSTDIMVGKKTGPLKL